MRISKNYLLIILLVGLLVGIGVYCYSLIYLLANMPTACDFLCAAQTQVPEGTTQDEAVETITEITDAWYYAECTVDEEGDGWHIFLYGPRDPDRFKNILVRFEDG